MPSRPEVFISYTNDTKRIAQTLVIELEKRGVSCWVDFNDLKPGQLWQVEIERALEKAASLLILIGPRSSTTPQLEAEWQACVKHVWSSEKTKSLIPIVFGDAELPPFLHSWVALHIEPGAKPSTWTDRVLSVIRSRPGDRHLAVTQKARSARQERFVELGKAVRSMKSASERGH